MNNKIQIEREARVHLAKGEWDMAIAAYRSLLEVSGENPNVYNLIGDAYVKMGDLGAAFKEYLQAIHLYTKEGLLENGVAVCKKVLRFRKDEPEVYVKLAEFYAKLGLGSDALDVLVAYSQKPQDLGRMKKAINKYKEIISLIAKNKRLLPKVKEICSKLGYKAEELDELLADSSPETGTAGASTQKPETKFEKTELNPSGEKSGIEPKKPFHKESMWFLTKVVNEIKDALNDGFEVDKDKNHYELGIIYKKLGLYKPAIEKLQKATGDSHHRLDAFKLLGLCFFENGDPESAINAFDQGLKEHGNDKDHAELHYWLGRAYELMKDNQSAVKEFEQTYVVDIKHRDVQERLNRLKGRHS